MVEDPKIEFYKTRNLVQILLRNQLLFGLFLAFFFGFSYPGSINRKFQPYLVSHLILVLYSEVFHTTMNAVFPHGHRFCSNLVYGFLLTFNETNLKDFAKKNFLAEFWAF
jgi:hypothetical protein